MPETDGKFTQMEFQKLVDWMNKSQIKCASCGNKQEQKGLQVGTYQAQIICSDLKLNYPAVVIVCRNCSYFNIFGVESIL